MNESTLIQLKVIVERAVRPVQASTPRKRKMREELLAHVSHVFEEESFRLREDRAALERTALRFGDPAEVTSQLQESVPARDALRRFWEGRPGEPPWRTALRLGWVTGTFTLAFAGCFFVVTWFAVLGVSAWPGEALILGLGAVLAVPVYLSGLAFLTDWMEKALYGPPGRSWLRIALVVAGSWLFMLLWLAAVSWPTWSVERDYRGAVLLAGWLVVLAPWLPYALARSARLRRQYHEEWAHLDLA
jgi:hypothetical protein